MDNNLMGLPFGKRLQVLRTERKMTQAALAEAAGISRPTLLHYESGDRIPSIDILVRLARALHVTADCLLGLGPEVTETESALMKKLGLSKASYQRLVAESGTYRGQTIDLLISAEPDVISAIGSYLRHGDIPKPAEMDVSDEEWDALVEISNFVKIQTMLREVRAKLHQ